MYVFLKDTFPRKKSSS